MSKLNDLARSLIVTGALAVAVTGCGHLDKMNGPEVPEKMRQTVAEMGLTAIAINAEGSAVALINEKGEVMPPCGTMVQTKEGPVIEGTCRVNDVDIKSLSSVTSALIRSNPVCRIYTYGNQVFQRCF